MPARPAGRQSGWPPRSCRRSARRPAADRRSRGAPPCRVRTWRGPRITFPGQPARRPVSARSTVPLAAADVGGTWPSSFEQGDAGRPIVMGSSWQPEPAKAASVVQSEVDGERLS